MKDDVAKRACLALDDALRHLRGLGVVDVMGYTKRLEENLLPGISEANLQRIQKEFGSGAGGELKGKRPKLCAAHSSAALGVNTFARWRNAPSDLLYLALGHVKGFESLTFECLCPSGLRGTPRLPSSGRGATRQALPRPEEHVSRCFCDAALPVLGARQPTH